MLAGMAELKLFLEKSKYVANGGEPRVPPQASWNEVQDTQTRKTEYRSFKGRLQMVLREI